MLVAQWIKNIIGTMTTFEKRNKIYVFFLYHFQNISPLGFFIDRVLMILMISIKWECTCLAVSSKEKKCAMHTYYTYCYAYFQINFFFSFFSSNLVCFLSGENIMIFWHISTVWAPSRLILYYDSFSSILAFSVSAGMICFGLFCTTIPSE